MGTTLYYLLSDHLGSSSVTVSDNGSFVSEMRYTAWGEVRYQNNSMPTDRTYTGQRSYTGDFGLMYYNARWYDSQLGRFAQADTVIPNGVQGYDRYAYVNNSPSNLTDPSGHCTVNGMTVPDDASVCNGAEKQSNTTVAQILQKMYGWTFEGTWSDQDISAILDAAVAIRIYTDKLTNGQGLNWMHHYMGNVTFDHNGWIPNREYVEQNKIHLIAGTFNAPGVVHELGHIVDNSSSPDGNGVMTGGGASDALNQAIGGHVSGALPYEPVRWLNLNLSWLRPITIPASERFLGANNFYGNGATADYFAETFRSNVWGAGDAPEKASAWMDGFIISFSIDSPSSIIR